MRRVWMAAKNSAAALGYMLRHEAAFQQEFVLLLLALPVGWILAEDAGHYTFLIGSVVLLILVEVLNTAVEAACNAITRSFDPNIKLAKDCGSLAVALAIVLTAAVWGFALYDHLFGAAI